MAGGRRPKYGNRKTVYQGLEFDSVLERDRWIVLREAEADGRITGLRRQVSFELVPYQYEDRTRTLKSGRTRTIRAVAEFPVRYVADFVYFKQGAPVIEDTKGHRTTDYVVKRKLMRWQGHPIREVRKAGEEV